MGKHSIDNTQIFEDFEGTWLDAFAPGTRLWSRGFLYHACQFQKSFAQISEAAFTG